MSYYLPFGPDIKLGQPYGARPGLYPNPSGGHNGDDWLTPVGTPVRAAGDGVITHAGQFDATYADNFGWNINMGGLMAVLNCDGDAAPYFEYAHLSKLLVKAGQRVKAGDIIALTGNTDGGTGVSTGAHCHVGCLPPNFNLRSSTYGRINPRSRMTKYWTGGDISYSGGTTAPTAPTGDDEMALTEETKKWLKENLLNKDDGGQLRADLGYQNDTLFSKADGAWQNAILAQISAAQADDLNKEDGGYIVSLLEAVKPGNMDPEAIADAVVGAVGADIAGEVVAAIGLKLAGGK